VNKGNETRSEVSAGLFATGRMYGMLALSSSGTIESPKKVNAPTTAAT
jgi:hypothetical protein